MMDADAHTAMLTTQKGEQCSEGGILVRRVPRLGSACAKSGLAR
jgi:hypothetical protein